MEYPETSISAELNIFQKITRLHEKANSIVEKAREMAFQAVDCALEIGNTLINQKNQLKHGEFEKWFNAGMSQCESAFVFDLRTAQNYMRIARFAKANPELTFGTVKEYYIACGIMPPPSTPSPCNDDLKPTFRLVFRETKPVADWTYSERLEFIEMSRPIVQKYQEIVSSDPSLASAALES